MLTSAGTQEGVKRNTDFTTKYMLFEFLVVPVLLCVSGMDIAYKNNKMNYDITNLLPEKVASDLPMPREQVWSKV